MNAPWPFTCWLPAANAEPRSAVVAVSAIVIARAGVVVVAPADDVAGVIVIAQDIARSPGPPAASIILVADEANSVEVGDFGGADRRRAERGGGSGGREQHGGECARRDGLHGVLPSVGVTIELYGAAYPDSMLANAPFAEAGCHALRDEEQSDAIGHFRHLPHRCV